MYLNKSVKVVTFEDKAKYLGNKASPRGSTGTHKPTHPPKKETKEILLAMKTALHHPIIKVNF